MKAVVKAESQHWFGLEEGVAVSKLSCIACISPVWRDQQKAATLQESGGFCRFVRRSEHPTGNFYLLLTRYLCRRFAYFKLGAHLLNTSGKSVNLLLLLRGSRF